ncbi:predicted protein [Arabidopsis lyrata subsp. lyrata]|uniref:Predicted protein n=1 Tax=Arabidopsis lyrata subsp. lyrata TaxID=81972 RepID=D7MIF5_ARALL|nr:predicted protein [Arabidopsis lyrata subsp. lyrata]
MCSSMELLPNHVVELILQRLPVKPLSRFKSVSKTWKSTIESQRFQQEQLSRRMQSQDPDVLFVPFEDFDYPRTRVKLGSSIVTTINKIPLSYYSQGHVFDFSTNAWRYVVPASPYRILYHNPVYLDGSLYWLTEEETNVLILRFDLHTETFQVISKAPFDHLPNPDKINMCILDNRLCVSELSWLQQVIWSFDSGTWKKLCSLDFTKSMSWFRDPCDPALPIAILEKKKLLLQETSLQGHEQDKAKDLDLGFRNCCHNEILN